MPRQLQTISVQSLCDWSIYWCNYLLLSTCDSLNHVLHHRLHVRCALAYTQPKPNRGECICLANDTLNNTTDVCLNHSCFILTNKTQTKRTNDKTTKSQRQPNRAATASKASASSPPRSRLCSLFLSPSTICSLALLSARSHSLISSHVTLWCSSLFSSSPSRLIMITSLLMGPGGALN